ALFNSLQPYISDASAADLFAGSGALGFEALSRGANSVVFVESDHNTAKLIRENARVLEVETQIKIIENRVEKVWDKISFYGPFDLIFADPPYALDPEIFLAGAPWGELLKPEGRLLFEWGETKKRSLSDDFEMLVKVREKNYGDSVLTTFCLKNPS
ncbi:MAG: hypothetical protein A3K03_00925, partial [Bdellovibrionales bacterium RIFOXYD1_FULL_44_7]